MAKSVAIVLAGGSGRRMGGVGNKAYLELNGTPLLSFSLAAFNRSSEIDHIVVVVAPGEFDAASHAAQMALADKTIAIVAGGADRHGSEVAGLNAVRAKVERGDVDLIAVHDGARPFPSQQLIGDVIAAAREAGGAVPGLPVSEPLFELRSGAAPRLMEEELVRVQTPQAFRALPLLEAYDAAGAAGFSAVDTAQTVERFGSLDIVVVPGEPGNIKVTYPADVAVADTLARRSRWALG